jgi:hypothetical protein
MRRQGKSGNLSNQFSDILAKAWLRQKAPHRSTHKGRGARRWIIAVKIDTLVTVPAHLAIAAGLGGKPSFTPRRKDRSIASN